MEKRIDCRGQACPQPVVETKKALEDPGAEELSVLLDSATSKENVRRFAESQGHQVSLREEAGVFELRIKKGKKEEKSPPAERKGETTPAAVSANPVLLIDADSLGRGSEELGRILMRSFLQTLEQSEVRPEKIIFINSGVKLACEGSPVLEDLQEFAAKGTEILSCGTCLEFFGIKSKLKVGKVSNMFEIINSLGQAGRIMRM
jgi:selenium metabolism protein YedF